ncbi:MAG: DUF1697 domain-containing protein [Spirochaetaceae bacterium]|nr:DUF1697 domain-containing protein [Spirochaetaceae bacterium]
MSERYLALLRGINVGGKNLIGKDDLRRCFEDLGFNRVRTYIQSGNVLFRTAATAVAELNADVEQALSDRFSYAARSVVLSHAGYAAALGAAPPAWGNDAACRHNALFTLAGVTADEVLANLPPAKPDIETVAAGPGIVFWSATKDRITRSAFMKLPTLPVYRRVTVRNHNTVRRLVALLDER